MAPLPKRRHSSRRQAKRTRALKQPGVDFMTCPQCSAPRLSHHVCQKCGFYDGKEVVVMKKSSNVQK